LTLVALVLLLPLPNAAAQPSARNVYGIQTLLTPDTRSKLQLQLDWARLLVGDNGHVTQPFFPVTGSTEGPTPEAVAFVDQAYASGLNPIVRLQGEFANGTPCDPSRLRGWLQPVPDAGSGEYTDEAAAYQRFVSGLPRVDGRTLYVQVWNEPNLHYMWGGSASAAEYGRFLVQVAAGIRALGDPRVKVLNGALAPEGDIDNLQFIHEAVAAAPGFASSFDYWASHPYPKNQPPANNLHSGTALPGSRYAIDAYLLEMDALKANGVDTGSLQVVLTETGYELNDGWYPNYPIITEENRAEYTRKAFQDYWSQWPEVLTVTPFQLTDSQGSWDDFEWVFGSSGADVNGFPTQPHLQYARLLRGVGLITGSVTDEKGRPLRDVKLETSANGHRSTSVRDGTYIMIGYPGVYEITAEKRGYLSATAGQVVVTDGGTGTLNLTLVSNQTREVKNPSVETGDLSDWTAFGQADGVEPHDGQYFLGTASNCVEKDGGYYQSIAATPGKPVTVSASILTYKDGPAYMASRMGLDPHGDTDPESGNIVWSAWQRTGGGWKRVSLTVTPQTEKVTIFLQHDQNIDNLWNINGFDRIEIVESE
jgi:hypothetical protein